MDRWLPIFNNVNLTLEYIKTAEKRQNITQKAISNIYN